MHDDLGGHALNSSNYAHAHPYISAKYPHLQTPTPTHVYTPEYTPTHTHTGTGATRKTYLARVSGKFGDNFPRQHQQPGSPPTPSALGQPIAGTTHDAGGLWWRYEPLRKGAEPRDSVAEDDVGKGTAGEGDEAVVQDMGGRGAGRGRRGWTGAEGTAAAYAVRVNCPIRVLDPKDGVYECHAEGKEAQTVSG